MANLILILVLFLVFYVLYENNKKEYFSPVDGPPFEVENSLLNVGLYGNTDFQPSKVVFKRF